VKDGVIVEVPNICDGPVEKIFPYDEKLVYVDGTYW